MSKQGAILESLREKRTTVVATGKKPQVSVKTICEKYKQTSIRVKEIKDGKVLYAQTVFQRLNEGKSGKSIKETTIIKDLEEMPTGKLKDPQIVLYSNGDKYYGEVCDRLPDGHGIVASKDGHMYDGDWKNGASHGKGTYIYPDNDLYVGEWKNGVRHGKGIFYIGDDIYEVEYYNGELVKSDVHD